MATLTMDPTISATIPADVSEHYITAYGTIALSAAGDTYATGGAVTNFAGVVPQGAPPVWVDIVSDGPTSGALSNVLRYVPGTTIANGVTKVFVFKGNATGIQALEELTDATAANNAVVRLDLDVLKFRAVFRKGA